MNRRTGRTVVLAVFAAAFLGPWPMEFGRGLKDAWRLFTPQGLPWLAGPLLAGAVLYLLIPLACLLAVVWPSPRVSGAVYRGLLFGAGIPFLALVVAIAFSLDRIPVDRWGLCLYVVALALALAAELLPVGAAPRDYARTFR